MIGTVQRNILHRMGDAWQAFKAAPTPGQLYPPQQTAATSYLTFPGWNTVEQQASGQDAARVKKALQSVSVFSNVQAIANEFSAAELLVKERTGDKLEDVANHPLEVLWEAPNPHMGRQFLMSFWAWCYTLVGKSYLYWLPAGGAVREVWPIPPFMIAPVPDGKDFIRGYAFKSSPTADPIFIPAEYVTYSHAVNIFDIRDSLSFLVAAMVDVNSEIAESVWNQNFFSDQNGVPDGLITISKDTLDTDLGRIRMELRDFFGGTRRGVAVARAGDMDYKPFGRSQKDVEFKEGLLLSQQRIDRAMGFPQGYWSERANRANAQQARETMIAGAVWPLLVGLSEDMNAGPVRRFFGEQYRATFKDIRPEDRELRLKEQESHKSHWTLNELREADGKEKLDDPRGDMLIAEIAKGTPLPATPASDQTEEAISKMEDEAGIGAEEAPALPSDEAAAPIEDTAMPTKASDLRKWETKALKAVRSGRSAAVRFESSAIPLPEQARIHEALKVAATPETVKAAFKAKAVRRTVGDLADDTAIIERARRLRTDLSRG